jgi:predicted MPP superfamily phosphohydrolase
VKQAIVPFNALMLLLVAGELWWLSRRKPRPFFLVFILLPVIVMAMGFLGAMFSAVDVFGLMQLLAWLVFLDVPLYLFGAAHLCWSQERSLSWLSGGLTAVILLVALDAFLVEPHWLQVSQVTIQSRKVSEPMRVAVIADLQTDEIGAYERQVFEEVEASDPDLVLLAGDYLHFLERGEAFQETAVALNDLMRKSLVELPLGMYAVRGNVDDSNWPEIFTGLGVRTFDTTEQVDVGPLTLTGLTLEDSGNTQLVIEEVGKFHIVLGHRPDFSLGEVDADLLIAGHTHGGQVRLPFVGPVLTLSAVSRTWAAGDTEIEPGKILIVSRGIGMERANAPRLRFLCRPELVIVDIVPAEGQ